MSPPATSYSTGVELVRTLAYEASFRVRPHEDTHAVDFLCEDVKRARAHVAVHQHDLAFCARTSDKELEGIVDLSVEETRSKRSSVRLA